MSPEADLTPPRPSPDCNYRIDFETYEAFNSHWVMLPTVRVVATGEALFAPARGWSLDESKWIGDAVVSLTLRKYPGNHRPGDLVVTIDCAARRATVGEGEWLSLGALEPALDASLTWIHAEPARTGPPGGVFASLRRWLHGR
jgi:hypothetical protein